MEDEILASIDKLDADQQVWAAEFDAGLAALVAGLAAEVDLFVDGLELGGRATTPEIVRSNLRKVTMWQADLPALLTRLGLPALVDKLLTRMDEGARRLNAYYAIVAPAEFVAATYAPVITALLGQTRALVLATVDNTVARALGDGLNWNVISRSTGAEMRTAIRAILTESGLPLRTVSTTASDALYTFSRGYSLAVAEGLGLKHYFYMGSRIVTTRDFCNNRYGRPYTQGEVESWAGLPWAGKIPGTTRVTIFWYLGGYRCRHRLLPISKSMYDYLINKTNGKDN